MKRIIALCLTSALLLCGCSADTESSQSASSAEKSEQIVTSATEPTTSATTVTSSQATASTTESATVDIETEEPVSEGSGTAVIAFAGDTTQSDVFADATSWRSMEYPFEDVAPIFSAADIAFVNLETCVSDRGQSEKKEGYGFRTLPEYLEVYTLAGIDIVSCANNHARDYGMDALADTFDNLEAYGLDFVGAGGNLAEAQKLVTYEVNGLTIGFTACNMINHNSTWYATEERAGLACVDLDSCQWYLDLISEYEKQCDVLLVSVHWGLEYMYNFSSKQQEFGHMLCDSGADVILGHHPHVLQPIEQYNDSVIFYSLGNFLFYKMDDYAGQTAIFEMEIDKDGFVKGKLSPVFISYCKSKLLGAEEPMYSEIIKLCQELSAPYGVSIDDNGVIELL